MPPWLGRPVHQRGRTQNCRQARAGESRLESGTLTTAHRSGPNAVAAPNAPSARVDGSGTCANVRLSSAKYDGAPLLSCRFKISPSPSWPVIPGVINERPPALLMFQTPDASAPLLRPVMDQVMLPSPPPAHSSRWNDPNRTAKAADGVNRMETLGPPLKSDSGAFLGAFSRLMQTWAPRICSERLEWRRSGIYDSRSVIGLQVGPSFLLIGSEK